MFTQMVLYCKNRHNISLWANNELVTRKIEFISSMHEEQSEENCSRKYGGLDTVASLNVKANHPGQTISCFSREENLLIEQKKIPFNGFNIPIKQDNL